MDCSHCGICCERTEMLLSNADNECIERLGYDRQKFVRYDKHGFARLKNRKRLCILFDVKKGRCKIYLHRPIGCRIYPVICSEQEGTVVDDLCPMRSTISKIEQKREGKKLIDFLQDIDNEARMRLIENAEACKFSN